MLRPRRNAALDVADRRKPLTAQISGHLAAAVAVMADYQKVTIARQFAKPRRKLPHRNVRAALNPADLHLVGFAHVQEQNAAGLRC